MKHLIIYAHPGTPNSMNYRVKEKIINTLHRAGHEVRVRDLYAIGFSPVLTSAEIGGRAEGNIPEDIKGEQEHINWADVIHVVYPVWWTGLPAILKGYFDRVFHYGFAYSFDSKGLVKLLGNKKAMLYSTHGMPETLYREGMYDALNLTSDTGIMEFCGIGVLNHSFFGSAMSADEETRRKYLDTVEELIKDKVILHSYVEYQG